MSLVVWLNINVLPTVICDIRSLYLIEPRLECGNLNLEIINRKNVEYLSTQEMNTEAQTAQQMRIDVYTVSLQLYNFLHSPSNIIL